MPNSPRATADDDGKQDSYLMQYLRSLPEEKRLMMEESLVNEINVNDQALAKGHVGGSTQGARKHKNGGDAKEDPSSKKSSSCIVL
ncbi:hypothetical protein R3I94_002660 [Phoxinus phoxinus]|uniref:Uncharacterized protein n=1 Tax=Phoxinus phoxinus TaxID=58324 RepID=A0AAN9DFP8_9TELE